MCWYLKDAKTIEELYLQIAVLDISIQALIKKSEKEGTLSKNREDILDLIMDLYASAERLREAVDNPSMIQDVPCE